VAVCQRLVVASNTAAVALYESMGFAVIGRTPGGFRHDQFGLVDTLIMFRPLGHQMQAGTGSLGH
jgi:ribosomal protein S18 acetylase RimI-like enzyme